MLTQRRLTIVLLCTLLFVASAAAITRISLPAAVADGRVSARMWGTGASSGDVIKLQVQRASGVPEGSLEIYVPAGLRVGASDAGAQNMVISGLSGRLVDDDTVEPADNIIVDLKREYPTLPEIPTNAFVSAPIVPPLQPKRHPIAMALPYEALEPPVPASQPRPSSVVYILEAYCADFQKDNPSTSTTFRFQGVDAKLKCILNGAETDSLEVVAKQAAIWMATNDIGFNEMNHKMDISQSQWNAARRVYLRCSNSGN